MAQWIKPNINIDFIGRRKKFWTLSTLVVSVSIIAMAANFFVRGDALNWGTDFKGGTQIQVQFAKQMQAGLVRKTLDKAGYKGAEVVQMGSAAQPNLFMLRLTETSAFSPKDQAKAKAALKQAFGDNLTVFEYEKGSDRIELRFKEGYKVAPGSLSVPEPAAAVPPATQPTGEAPATQPAAAASQPAAAPASQPAAAPATPPAADTKARDPKANDDDKAGGDDKKADDKKKADDTKADDEKADETKADDKKADDEKADDAKADDAKADDKKADDKKADDKKADVPVKKKVMVRPDFIRLRDMLKKAGVHVQNVVQPGRAQDNRYDVILGGLGEDVRKVFGPGVVQDIPQVESVGAKMGSQLRNDGIKSVLYALLLMLVYIAFRFDFRYAPGAVVALAHDVVITTGIFAVTWTEFNLPVVAALLTIAGYSINDTIVVFDRIRENVARLRDRKFPLVVNASINETLSRTLLTSLTTLFTCISIWVIGTGVLKTFAFALTAGVLVGTYSSVFIASPIVVVLNDKLAKRAKAR